MKKIFVDDRQVVLNFQYLECNPDSAIGQLQTAIDMIKNLSTKFKINYISTDQSMPCYECSNPDTLVVCYERLETDEEFEKRKKEVAKKRVATQARKAKAKEKAKIDELSKDQEAINTLKKKYPELFK